MPTVNLIVNGEPVTLDVDDPKTPLLNILSFDLGLNGPKFGCGLSLCGSCTVLRDGVPIRSCSTTVASVNGASITTIEGLGTPENPHPIQQAFIDEQAIHCGYCISGVMLYAKATIDANPNATDDDINQGMSGIMCRCNAYYRMFRAIKRYQQAVQS